MIAAGRSGSVVTLLADSGDRYADTYFDDEWLTSQGIDPSESGRVTGRVRAVRPLVLIVGALDERAVGGQEQPQRRQDEEPPIDGRSQPGHVVPRFCLSVGALPSS